MLKIFWFFHSAFIHFTPWKSTPCFLWAATYVWLLLQMVEADPVVSSRGGYVSRHKSIGLFHSSGLGDWFIGGHVTENRILAIRNRTYSIYCREEISLFFWTWIERLLTRSCWGLPWIAWEQSQHQRSQSQETERNSHDKDLPTLLCLKSS